MGEVSEISKLVDSGRIDEAVRAAGGLNPRLVADLLFDSGGFVHDMAPYDTFFRRWYQTLDSPFLRAEAAERFGDAYLTELAGVPGGEAFGAELVTTAIRDVIAHTVGLMRGPEVSEWAEPHVDVMPRGRALAWREAADRLSQVHLPD